MAVTRHNGKVCLDCAVGKLRIEMIVEQMRAEGADEDSVVATMLELREEYDIPFDPG